MNASKETGWRCVAASMAYTMNLTRLLEPRTEPLRLVDVIGATVLTIAGGAVFYFWWGIS